MRVIACQRTDPRSVSQAGGSYASAKALAKREERQTEKGEHDARPRTSGPRSVVGGAGRSATQTPSRSLFEQPGA